MIDYIFVFPVIFGWLMFFSGIAQYIFYLKKNKFSPIIKKLFFIFLFLMLVSMVVWAVFRNL